MAEDKNLTSLSRIGEFELIEKLTSSFKSVHKNSVLGVGDDAAVIEGGKTQIVLSTDLLVEGIHFDMAYSPLKHLGYKAVVVNLSDIYAMNAIPEQITVSIAVSAKYTMEALLELYEGIKLACDRYKVDLVGGDTTISLSDMMISVSVVGRADEKAIVRRSGAREHDLLCVTGDLGAAYLGLQVLEREKEIFEENKGIQPDLSGNDYILERILKPEARKDVIEYFSEKKIIPTSMIDISDGLSSEIHHLCKHSECGMKIYESKIPIDHTVITKAEEFNLEPMITALNGGEDYELLFTADQSDLKDLEAHGDIRVIGHVMSKESGILFHTNSDQVYDLKAMGWDGMKP